MAHYSHVISTLVRTEKQALTLSLFGCISFAIFGIGYGLFVGSNAIMLDGIFTLFSMGMTGLGLITAYLVTRPSDARFQYGYAHFEPITNVINGTIILLLCLGALYSGITTLLDGGREIDLGHALIYAAVSTFFCAPSSERVSMPDSIGMSSSTRKAFIRPATRSPPKMRSRLSSPS